MEAVIESKRIVQRSFVICKRGNAFIPIKAVDILLIMHHSGVNFAIDKGNNKYLVEKTLSEFEEILDEALFFRVNRQAIVNINFIKEFRSLEFGKILIELKDSSWINNDLVVSQVNARKFRHWVDTL